MSFLRDFPPVPTHTQCTTSYPHDHSYSSSLHQSLINTTRKSHKPIPFQPPSLTNPNWHHLLQIIRFFHVQFCISLTCIHFSLTSFPQDGHFFPRNAKTIPNGSTELLHCYCWSYTAVSPSLNPPWLREETAHLEQREVGSPFPMWILPVLQYWHCVTALYKIGLFIQPPQLVLEALDTLSRESASERSYKHWYRSPQTSSSPSLQTHFFRLRHMGMTRFDYGHFRSQRWAEPTP